MIDPRCSAPAPTFRFIPSRFPPIPLFDTVATAADVYAVMDLEGWTNDRIVSERLARLPKTEWVYGVSNASIVMAAFLHSPILGARFNGPDLGAWYGAASERTSVAEVAHHLRLEAMARGHAETRRTFRSYTATLLGDDYADLRGCHHSRPELYSSGSYSESMKFGEQIRAAGQSGIVYDSVRHIGGTNIVVHRPRNVTVVTQASHYDILAPVVGKVVVRQL